MTQRRPTIMLVCSSGGHLLQLVMMRDAWAAYERVWVTFEKDDAKSLLADERTVWGHFPTNRNVANLLRNTFLAWRVLRRERPDVVVSNGAGIGIPFCWIGRLLGAHIIYIESFARVTDLSLTGKLVRPVAHRFLVQWPTLHQRHPWAEFHGAAYGIAGSTNVGDSGQP